MKRPRVDFINTKHLFYFYTIANEGSIKGACQKLGLTPAALSSQLKQLETDLGCNLFDRHVRKLELNRAGKIAFDYSSNIFRKCEELRNSLSQRKAKEIVNIYVGVLPTLSKNHTHEFVLPLWKDQSVCVSVIEGTLSELLKGLTDSSLDIILLDRPTVSTGSNLRAFRLRPRKIIAVAAKKFQWVKRKFPHSLNEQPFLHVTKHSQIRAEIDFYLERHSVKPTLVGEADDAALLRIAAEKGIGITVLPKNTVTESLAARRLIQIGELKDVRSDMWAILPAESPHFSRLENVIERFLDQNP